MYASFVSPFSFLFDTINLEFYYRRSIGRGLTIDGFVRLDVRVINDNAPNCHSIIDTLFVPVPSL